MRIWTTQTRAFWEQLQAQGAISCESRYAADDELFRSKYDWLSDQMRHRVGPPPRPEIQYPIWGWKQVGNYKKERHPSLQDGTPLVSEQVFLTLEIPEDKVLLSDFYLWGEAVLNNFFIPADRADSRQFDKIEGALRNAGIPFKEWPEDIKAIVQQSWERIFDLGHPNYFQSTHKRNRWIQATFWELRKEWVVSCVHKKM